MMKKPQEIDLKSIVEAVMEVKGAVMELREAVMVIEIPLLRKETCNVYV